MVIRRQTYLDKLGAYIKTPLVKILTGVRRAGKSTILRQLIDEIRSRGAEEDALLYLDFDDFELRDIADAKTLYERVKEWHESLDYGYLFLDEVQRVNQWEDVVNSLMSKGDTDIYITGSNSTLLSSELATLLSGKYVEINVQTLSFNEYLSFCTNQEEGISRSSQDKHALFKKYLAYGGFPVLTQIDGLRSEVARQTLRDVYSSVILHDVVERNKIRNVDTLERLVRFIFDNIGQTFAARTISGYFTSIGRKINEETIYRYMHALEEAFVIQKAPRFDVRGKGLLAVQEKYYAADIGLSYALFGRSVPLIPGVLENLVFLELRARGYEAYVGRLRDKEIDFVGTRQGQRIYIQVCYQLGANQDTIQREFGPLLAIADQYPKYVVTLDEEWDASYQGIARVHLADFLTAEW